MKFIKEIFSQIAAQTDTSFALQYFVVDGVSAYFQNIRSVFSFSESEIVFLVSGGKVVVRGERLFIRKLCGGDALVDGNITSVERKKDG